MMARGGGFWRYFRLCVRNYKSGRAFCKASAAGFSHGISRADV